MHFTISDNTDKEVSLPVVYHGTVPDTFKVGRQVVLEGHYKDDVFTAKSILTKCASRYEPAE
jgi:cytochrome c-type biogenesis protein CcmE